MCIVKIDFINVIESLETYMEDHKNQKKSIPYDSIKSIIFQLFTGLKYAHSKSKA